MHQAAADAGQHLLAAAGEALDLKAGPLEFVQELAPEPRASPCATGRAKIAEESTEYCMLPRTVLPELA